MTGPTAIKTNGISSKGNTAHLNMTVTLATKFFEKNGNGYPSK